MKNKLSIAKSSLAIVYFGTPDFSACFLEKLLTDTSINRSLEVKFVVTQPDRPVGRKRAITKTPVKTVAEKYNLPVIDKLKSLTNELQGMDFAFLFAYGSILPDEILNQPRLGFFNTHPSLLPKYRGPSPIATPLINGDTETGVTLIRLDDKIDHGSIIAQEKSPIDQSIKRPDLEIQLTALAFTMFKKLISSNLNQLQPIPQDEKTATYTKLLTKQDGFIPFFILQKALKNEPFDINELPITNNKSISNFKLKISNSPETIFNIFRGLYPWPGLWTFITPTRCETAQRKRLKILDMQYQNGKLTILRVQLEGKKEVDFNTFNRAYRIF